jgi:hypothetical protein
MTTSGSSGTLNLPGKLPRRDWTERTVRRRIRWLGVVATKRGFILFMRDALNYTDMYDRLTWREVKALHDQWEEA